MMNRHFRLRSELSGAIAKRLPYAKNHTTVIHKNHAKTPTCQKSYNFKK